MASVKLFSGSASRLLAEQIAKAYGQELGSIAIQRFSDGEMCPNFNESIRGDDVFLIQSTMPPGDNLVELLLMIDAARRASTNQVIVVCPYYGYARQDRKDKPRVAIGAKLVANLLSAAGAQRLMTCDLHADQIQGFLDFPVDHLDGTAIFFPYLQGLNLKNTIFAAPDVGGMKRVRRYAEYFQADMVVIDKYRKRANEVAGMTIIGDVAGGHVILVDDLVDTGGTLCRAADLVMDRGAASVRAVVTHGILSGNAAQRIAESKLSELVITDTIPPRKELGEKITVLSVARLFAEAIKRVHGHESISSLFV